MESEGRHLRTEVGRPSKAAQCFGEPPPPTELQDPWSAAQHRCLFVSLSLVVSSQGAQEAR